MPVLGRRIVRQRIENRVEIEGREEAEEDVVYDCEGKQVREEWSRARGMGRSLRLDILNNKAVRITPPSATIRPSAQIGSLFLSASASKTSVCPPTALLIIRGERSLKNSFKFFRVIHYITLSRAPRHPPVYRARWSPRRRGGEVPQRVHCQCTVAAVWKIILEEDQVRAANLRMSMYGGHNRFDRDDIGPATNTVVVPAE
ncbi:hypothetical protein C8R44DRAFT_725545 [Mycena epipterygia]|nr:hypothetical protein C8R44DRAFT_725545 [Mycena epipterygia]